MPVLKNYADGSGCYIHASVRGAVVTFQTTSRAVERLAEAGFGPGVRFPLRLLADLTQSGDAYTRRGAYVEAEQFEFDFNESEESEHLFPACAVTGSFEDLHLVVREAGGDILVELLAPSARASATGAIRLSIPLDLLSPSALETLEKTSQIPPDSAAATALRRWYTKSAISEWERLGRDRKTRQQALALGMPGELNL